MPHPRTPILIGVGQLTEREEGLEALSSPMDLMEGATWASCADAGIDREKLSTVDTLVVVRSFREPMANSADVLARRVGATAAESWMMPNGGNGPQYLVNRYSEAIARGEARFCLFSGAEAMDNGRRLVKAGITPEWDEPAERERRYLVADKKMSMDIEDAHGLMIPSNAYPCYENALRGHYGESIAAHQQVMGELFSKFTQVAAQHPLAWYPIERSAEEIATATPSNRFVGWPYTKFMNAMNQINQSATLLLTSVEYAQELGVPEEKWVYLHGCADASELWHMLDRENYHSSVAIRTMGRKAFEMADLSMDEITHIDIYSCFPSAVQIARDEFGIAKDDPRPLTITGGLPFHGGAGNNYVMNSIASMVDVLRANAGDYGLVTANGGYLTKHSAGIYSTKPTEVAGDVPFVREDPATYQAEIDATPHPEIVERPDGDATVETYTVLFGREGTPEGAIVIGRDGKGRRFVAHTPRDADLLMAMTQEDFLGARGTVHAGSTAPTPSQEFVNAADLVKPGDTVNIFTPAA